MHSNSPEELTDTLRGVGLRVTEPRLAVLRSLAGATHLDAAQVFDAVRTDLPDTSVQAVYGVLNALTEANLVRKIEPAGSTARYERRVGDNHHHIICTECGAIADVDCVAGHAPCLLPENASGFQVREAEVNFWGTCPKCQASAEAARL